MFDGVVKDTGRGTDYVEAKSDKSQHIPLHRDTLVGELRSSVPGLADISEPAQTQLGAAIEAMWNSDAQKAENPGNRAFDLAIKTRRAPDAPMTLPDPGLANHAVDYAAAVRNIEAQYQLDGAFDKEAFRYAAAMQLLKLSSTETSFKDQEIFKNTLFFMRKGDVLTSQDITEIDNIAGGLGQLWLTKCENTLVRTGAMNRADHEKIMAAAKDIQGFSQRSLLDLDSRSSVMSKINDPRGLNDEAVSIFKDAYGNP
jgi:hypothetical protein